LEVHLYRNREKTRKKLLDTTQRLGEKSWKIYSVFSLYNPLLCSLTLSPQQSHIVILISRTGITGATTLREENIPL
jgi:hypothetical protein